MKNEYSNLPPDLTRIERKVLSLRFGKGMRLIDIAAELKMPEERVLIMERKSSEKDYEGGWYMINPTIKWTDEELVNVLYDSASFSEDEIEHKIFLPAFRDVIRQHLTEREQIVLHMRHAEGKSLEEVAKHFNVTRERIRQIDAKTFRKLTWSQTRSHYIMIPLKDLNNVQKKLRDIQVYVTDLSNSLNRLEVTSALSPKMYDKIFRDLKRLRIAAGVETEDETVDLGELDLSVRLYNCLARRGIHDLRIISTMTPTEIMKIRNLGRHTYDELMEVCEKYGISPKDE